MKRFIGMIGVVFGAVSVQLAHGHGTSIDVKAPGSTLVVSGIVSSGGGFAPAVFVEDNANGDPSDPLPLPQVGYAYVWQVPGFAISGLDVQSSLSIDVLSRPVNNATPLQSRVLWYWNSATQQIETASAPLYLLGTAQRYITLAPNDSAPPGSFLLADPVGNSDRSSGGQQYLDNHGLLAYALDSDNDPAATPGAYGFFARLTSDEYSQSNPFLVVLNFGVDHSQMVAAAQAINAAAFLPGDYNHDDHVDAADYVIWRKTLNSSTQLAADGSGNQLIDAADYDVWRMNAGHSVTANGQLNVSVVPEPAAWLLVVYGLMLVAIPFRRRTLILRRSLGKR